MTRENSPRIAIIGSGMGGTTAAIMLQRTGHRVDVYEQGSGRARVGAGINLDPQSMRIMRRLGLEQRLIDIGRVSETRLSRDWDTGHVTLEVPVDKYPELYDGNHFSIHRGDLQDVLSSAVAPGTVHFGRRLIDITEIDGIVRLGFADGSTAEADLVIGADGVHSRVRDILLGGDPPDYIGRAAYRAIMPSALFGDWRTADHVKWWKHDRYFLTYYLTRARDEFYFTANVPEPEWGSEDFGPMPADMERLRAHFAGFHPEVQRVLDACPGATRWPVREREAFPLWSRGRVVLLGDACHPMPPFMGQGAAMAFEDAIILARCLDTVGADDPARLYRLYEAQRFERTSTMQRESRKNEWLQYPMDPGWVFNYDPFTIPLIPAAVNELR
jgi:6-hydroxynicotinate 3-monooxygenase